MRNTTVFLFRFGLLCILVVTWLSSLHSSLSFSSSSSNHHHHYYYSFNSAASSWLDSLIFLPKQKNDLVIYAQARNGHDRAGMIITEMMNAHAFTYRNGSIYGGYCLPLQLQKQHNNYDKNDSAPEPPLEDPLEDGNRTIKLREHHAQAYDILEALGLQEILPLACPSAEQVATGKHLMNRNLYHSLAIQKVWTPSWVAYMHRHVQYPPTLSPFDLVVAMHLRRGDVSPCEHSGRYLPNAHYLRLLERYVLSIRSHYNSTVINIYSQSDSFESWEDLVHDIVALFGGKPVQVKLHLDTPLRDVWLGMVTASVVILSRSSFGMVPAMLNARATAVIYTPFPRRPLPDWVRVSDELVEKAEEEVMEMRQTRNCSNALP